MKPTSPTEIALLTELVAIPSVSGDEAAVAQRVEESARAWGLDVVCLMLAPVSYWLYQRLRTRGTIV